MFRDPRPTLRRYLISAAVPWLSGLLLPAASHGLPTASWEQEGAEGGSAGQLAAAVLAAQFGEGGAVVRIALDLVGVEGRRTLPIQALAFGGVPEELEASVDGRVGRTRWAEERPGFWSGGIEWADPLPDRVRLRITYRVRDAVHRSGSGASGSEALLALPWVMIPWPPEDGAPGRVRMSLTFPEPLTLRSSFPASLRPAGAGEVGPSETWHAALPVLPSLTRARIDGAPDRIVSPQGRLPAPPDTQPPGFVFYGLFLTCGGLAAGYVLWMVRREHAS